MATTVKRETLKSIGNVPDWVLKQRSTKDGKKEPAKVVRPKKAATPKPKPATDVLSVAKSLVVPQAIKEEVKHPQDKAVEAPTAGSQDRKIYSREFLYKFKYTAPSFPPGALTPMDLIAQYNREFEQRERIAQQDTSSLTNTKPTPSSPAYIAEAAPATTGEKKLKKKKKEGEQGTEGTKKEKNTFKLRLAGTDDSILRSPLFRASAKTPVKQAPLKVEDKENPSTIAKPARSASVPKTAPALVSLFKKESIVAPIPAPVVPATVAVPAPAVAPATVAVADAVMQDAKPDELVDVLTKKLKAVLKETDPRRLAQRQKQIEYGKATPGYQDYMKQIAKTKRKREDPKTPNKYQVCSKRSWDGQVRKWRRMLHVYDPADLKEGQSEEMESKNFEITEADLLAEENALRE
jgi:hypothetical protein